MCSTFNIIHADKMLLCLNEIITFYLHVKYLSFILKLGCYAIMITGIRKIGFV